MNKLLIQLRIGEKVAIGVGLVGLLFLGVIWFYQQTLKQSLTDYQSLVQIHTANKDHLLAIENKLLIARQFDTQYMRKRDPVLAQKVYENLVLAQQEVERLLESGHNNQSSAAQFNNQLQAYGERFKAVEEAWNKKGINEEAGLQGSFRNAVHDLEKMAGNLNADSIYLILLQIRRSEKDLGLRRETLYRQRVHSLIERFIRAVETSQLLTEVKEQLLSEIAIYRNQFDLYAEKALSGQPIEGGKGLFRDSAHRLEDLLNQYYVPDLERDILQLRRREKDYLLRGDEKYVQMVLNQIAAIEERIENSDVSAEERKHFTTLLQRYRTDFLALTEQNQLIEELTTQMEERASRVTSLVNRHVATANQTIADLIQQINLRVQERTVWMMWVIVIAIGFGIFFTIKIISLIVRPMREMAAVLEKLTHTELISPIRHIEGGRDEVNHMAGFINTLVDHRNRFIRWWRNSMNQEKACSQLRSILERPTRHDAETITEIDKLRQAIAANMDERKRLIVDETEEIGKQTAKILSCSAMLLHPSIGRGDVDEQAKMIYYAAEMIKRHLEMLSK